MFLFFELWFWLLKGTGGFVLREVIHSEWPRIIVIVIIKGPRRLLTLLWPLFDLCLIWHMTSLWPLSDLARDLTLTLVWFSMWPHFDLICLGWLLVCLIVVLCSLSLSLFWLCLLVCFDMQPRLRPFSTLFISFSYLSSCVNSLHDISLTLFISMFVCCHVITLFVTFFDLACVFVCLHIHVTSLCDCAFYLVFMVICYLTFLTYFDCLFICMWRFEKKINEHHSLRSLSWISWPILTWGNCSSETLSFNVLFRVTLPYVLYRSNLQHTRNGKGKTESFKQLSSPFLFFFFSLQRRLEI